MRFTHKKKTLLSNFFSVTGDIYTKNSAFCGTCIQYGNMMFYNCWCFFCDFWYFLWFLMICIIVIVFNDYWWFLWFVLWFLICMNFYDLYDFLVFSWFLMTVGDFHDFLWCLVNSDAFFVCDFGDCWWCSMIFGDVRWFSVIFCDFHFLFCDCWWFLWFFVIFMIFGDIVYIYVVNVAYILFKQTKGISENCNFVKVKYNHCF